MGGVGGGVSGKMKIYKHIAVKVFSNIQTRASRAAPYLVLVSERARPALNILDGPIRCGRPDSGLCLDIQALARAVLHSDVKVVRDVEVLARGIIDALGEPDGASIGRVVAEVDTLYFASAGVEDPDLGRAEVVVEEL